MFRILYVGFFGVFLMAFLITLLLVPPIKRLAFKVDAIDLPDERKVHSKPVPRLGGLAIYLGVLLTVLITLPFLYSKLLTAPYGMVSVLGYLTGATIMVLIGIVDDIKGVSAVTKLVVQIIAASCAVASGIQIEFISNPFGSLIPLYFLSVPVTIFWIVGITNAVNLIDGLDGLASGVTAIAAVTLCIVAFRTHQIAAVLALAALAGGCVGFLKYNFNPASIFLGDTGSLFLGYSLAVASVIGVLKSTIVIALIIPILVLGIPIFDTASAMLRRVKGREHIFKADKGHLHHQLLDVGFTQRQAVLAIYAACLLLCAGALIITFINAVWVYFVLIPLILVAILSLDKAKESIRKAMEKKNDA